MSLRDVVLPLRRHEGTRRAALRHADGWHDMHLHARLADGEAEGADARHL